MRRYFFSKSRGIPRRARRSSSRNQVAMPTQRKAPERKKEEGKTHPAPSTTAPFPHFPAIRTQAVHQHHYCRRANRAPERPKRSCCSMSLRASSLKLFRAVTPSDVLSRAAAACVGLAR